MVGEINDLICAINILTWDSRTQMPAGGIETRGHQLATLSRIVQERFVSEKFLRALDAAEEEVVGEDEDSYRVRNVRAAREANQIARRIPAALVGEFAAAQDAGPASLGRGQRSRRFCPLCAPSGSHGALESRVGRGHRLSGRRPSL